jgi:hypothetical protein
MHTAMRLTRNTTTNSIRNANTKSPAFQAVPERQNRIRRLTRLRNKHADIVTENGRFAVEKVGGEFNIDGDFSQFFENGSRLHYTSKSILLNILQKKGR